MLISRLKTAAAVLATVVLAAGIPWGLPARALAGEGQTHGPTDPAKATSATDFSAVDDRVREIQPTPKEKRFEEIGWACGIRDAERLARENDRPVFLFVNVGRMDLGRC